MFSSLVIASLAVIPQPRNLTGMVVLDAGIFRELYAKHQIYKKLEESERDFAEGRHQDAYEMLTDVFSSAHV